VPRGAPRKPCRWLCVARAETRPRAEGDCANRNASSPEEESIAGEGGPCGDLAFAGSSEMFALRAARFAVENAKSSSLRARYTDSDTKLLCRHTSAYAHDETAAGTCSGSSSGADSREESGADSGADSSTELGAEPWADSNADSGAEPGADSSAESGAELGADSNVDSEAEPGP
ncbi:hypothetical protein DDJ49_30465, partial [Klebsiella pneumoniae]